MQLLLVTEHTFHASYLVSRWIDWFERRGVSTAIALRTASPSPSTVARLRALHAASAGSRTLTGASLDELRELYGAMSRTDLAMLDRFGLPAHPTLSADTIFLGDNLNDPRNRSWLEAICVGAPPPFVCVFLDRLLDPWWIATTRSRLVNAHSAVLPFARGAYAIENLAITRDSQRLRQAAGAAVHYVDAGIDTGPIVRTERLTDPFAYSSIWDLKGASFALAFELLVESADAVARRPDSLPVGTVPEASSVGPCFFRRNFTTIAQGLAEEGFAAMQREAAPRQFEAPVGTP